MNRTQQQLAELRNVTDELKSVAAQLTTRTNRRRSEQQRRRLMIAAVLDRMAIDGFRSQMWALGRPVLVNLIERVTDSPEAGSITAAHRWVCDQGHQVNFKAVWRFVRYYTRAHQIMNAASPQLAKRRYR